MNDNFFTTKAGLQKLVNKEFHKKESLRQAVCVVLTNPEGKILAVSRKNDHNDFGLPGGKVDPGETEEYAITRETFEETGLKLKKLWKVYSNFDGDFWVTGYLATWSGQINTTEDHVIKWVEPEALIAGSFGDYNREMFRALMIFLKNRQK